MTEPRTGRGTDTGNTGGLRVLLVDDEPENLVLLEDLLADNGYTTCLAHNGLEALSVFSGETIHLIVADAMMPKMDGFQLCKEVRALPAGGATPFIIYTGNYVDAADREFARSIGVDRYVVKGAGPGVLVEAVNELASMNYGRQVGHHVQTVRGDAAGQIDDQAFLEGHRAIVIKKLEEKMAELQIYAETLVHKSREIEESEERYRSLFDNASIAIFVADRETGRVLDVNAAGVRLLGRTWEELRSMSHLPIGEDCELAATVRGAYTYSSGETTVRTKDGGLLQVEVGVAALQEPDNRRVLLFVRDITEQKRLREQLLQAEKMTLMGRLAAGIAHEVRNPLAAISLNVQYLIQRLHNDPDIAESLNDALEGARRVESVIENTLGLARATPPVLKQQEVNPIVRQVLGFARMSRHHKDVEILSDLAEGLPPIEADGKQIQQVVLNVLQNAIDASPTRGEVDVTTCVASFPNPAGGFSESVVVAVRDHGPGISAEQRKHLFEQFFTTKAGGTGLGLALSKQIMERHRGDIHLESADGGGTLVRLLFPIHTTTR